MIQDDEFEVLEPHPSRIQTLGFKPQREISTNTILPYAAELDEESNKFLEQVKTNLAKAVMLREMKPACGIWSSRLMKYIRIYGLKFSKEDHIALIKLAFELVLIPELEPCKIHKFATMFLLLTKKRYLISPEELTLPWRPLYDVGKKIFDKRATHIGMYHYLTPKKSSGNDGRCVISMVRKFLAGSGVDDALALFGYAPAHDADMPTSLEGSFMSMVKCARPYFDVSATKEILAEFLPQICPWASDTQTLSYLAAFLPVELNPKHAARGHELWFEELMTLWDTCYNAQCRVSEVMTIFSGLAKRNPGAIDWTPHVPKMFTRFLHALNLPVSYKDMQYSRNHSLYTKYMASWIVWSMRPDGVILQQLRSFLGTVESYLHSANQGRWSYKLRDLLRKLSREILNRVRRERSNKFKKGWENQTPEHLKLRDEDITEFVTIVLEPTLQAVYGRSGSVEVALALQNLATLRPAIVVPPLVDKLRTALTSLTEPHRVTVAMSAVAAVARPLLRGAEAGYPEGPTHVVPLLLAVLPGLDPNDFKKTLVTLHFILIFSWMVPYIDCSSAHEHWPDLTEEELLTCESTAQFEDFVLVFLDRIFIIIESSVMENVRLDTKEADWARSRADAVMETGLSSAATSVLMQCSPRIFREALRKFRAFATESTFETNVSGSMVGVLLRVFARVDASATLAAFLPDLCARLTDLLATDDARKDENPPRDLLYTLVLLKQVVECDGTVLLKYMDIILPVLDRALKLHANTAITQACDVLSHVLTSLSCVDLKEWRSSPNDYSAAPEKWLPVREWGRGCLLKDTNLQWHVPSAEEAECAQMLFNRYLEPEVARLEEWLSGARPMCRERRLRSFYIINAALSCGTFLPAPEEEPVMLAPSLVPPTALPYTTGVTRYVTLRGDNTRASLTRLLLRVQERMLGERDDPRGLECLVQVWERVVGARGARGGPGLEARLRAFGALERALDGQGGASKDSAGPARLRMLLADAARLQDEARLDLGCDAGIPPSALQALHALLDLSLHTYSSVRMLAQLRLYWMLGHFPYSYRALVPRLSELLAAGGDGDEWHARHKGALFIMLGPRTSPLVAKHDWDTARTLWPAILTAPLSEKPSILKLEQAFGDSLHRHFPTVNTRLTVTTAVVDAARTLAPDSFADEQFVELFNKAIETEKATSDHAEKMYRELIDELVSIAEAPGVQWRRLELAMQMLTFCPSVQTAYPPRAVRCVLRALLHDDIAVRRTAHRLVHYVLKQRKRPLKKVLKDPYEIAGMKRPEKRVPGYREDLEWVMWSDGDAPATDEEWDRPWLRNPLVGFYSWPDKIEVAAPQAEQTFSFDVRPEDMEEGERYILEFFSDETNVDKLVAFLTVEEKKGKDKFSGVRFAVFRMLFAQFGENVADKFMAHALRCASDPQEAPQRFAAEVAAAALRAPRYWPRERALAFHEAALNVVRAGLSAVTPETMEDWGTALATGVEKMDPRRGARVLRALRAACAPARGGAGPDHDTSFAVCARLYALQGALGSLTWRAAPLAADLLCRLDDANFIHHPYQNVRETVGSILMTIFDTELVFPGGGAGGAPRIAEFLDKILPRLAALYDENGDIIVKTSASLSPIACAPREEPPAGPERGVPVPLGAQVGAAVDVAQFATEPAGGERPVRTGSASPDADEGRGERLDKRLAAQLDSALRLEGASGAPAAESHARAASLLTTVLRGCMGVVVRGVAGSARAQYVLVRVACAAAARGPPQPHEELPRAADGFLASLARQHHEPDDFDAALAVLEEVAAGRSWWARLACLEFAQPLLFYGLPLIRDQPERASRVERFSLKLMRDPRLEVRQSAAKLLTGLMHCKALPDENRTMRVLMRSCRSSELVERHCGVLGMCAYLASRPYSLGPQLGAVLAELSRHAGAPDPVPATIRAALADFRRTHHDDWQRHRDQLTEDELDLLADLTSPPSYCA